MRPLYALMICISFAAGMAFAQDVPESCPVLSMSGPPGIVMPGENATFAAELGANAAKFALTFQWSATGGELVEGQGTSTVKVKWFDPCNTNLTVTVKVSGVPDSCPVTLTETAGISCLPTPTLITELPGRLPVKGDRRFAEILLAIKDNPNSQIYVLVSPKVTTSKRRDIFSRLGLNGEQQGCLTFMDGLPDRDLYQFWLVPPGADDPRP